jgi:hypothetical protein
MKEFNFTPRIGYGEFEERLGMRLSAGDHKKIERGQRWQAVVTDLNTGKGYFVRGASCGSSGCYCDAVATEMPAFKGRKKPNLLEAAKTALSLLQDLQWEYEEEMMPMGPLQWPPIEALSVAIRLEEGKRARQRKLHS